ncbi:uncharacterized protein K460DRAFT_333868 [Cucurbitaria berberidis CBS 394.84]|uniref:Lysine-specific metallo-endopeptidase domain-containing protein n=1 Tax=Cucurbitaria berberidis CBS 394.84 TaxID=1168544 RepID=A0A9P4GMP6_9PLEO|nr:uncharacterized protein K460DRAFT_333868 [Cucurbitaria berberidis CBS 394.84]KAF1848131.1 hypothetical protein K460DRAFT_333868 [Cucurbitaria berberidis CBS 394.84]
MAWFYFLCCLCLYFSLPAVSLAYKIDQSCTQKGIEQDVRNAMTSAFEMADAAIKLLTANPRNSDTIELLGFLFAKDGVDPRQLLDNGGLEKTTQVLRAINNLYRDEVTGNAPVSINDVIIFCHYDRFKLIDKKKKLYRDLSNGIALKFDEQQCRGSMMDRISLAVTVNPISDEDVLMNGVKMSPEKPTQIQLCLWFVDWIKDRRFKLHNDVARSNIGRAVIKLAESKNFGLRQIDAFSLLDKVLLHEMTHGRGAYTNTNTDVENVEGQVGLADVSSPNGFLALFGWAAYGWKAAMELARKGDNLGGENAPDNNADTIALLGSVCKLMDDPSNPRKVDVKGRIIPRK